MYLYLATAACGSLSLSFVQETYCGPRAYVLLRCVATLIEPAIALLMRGAARHSLTVEALRADVLQLLSADADQQQQKQKKKKTAKLETLADAIAAVLWARLDEYRTCLAAGAENSPVPAQWILQDFDWTLKLVAASQAAGPVALHALHGDEPVEVVAGADSSSRKEKIPLGLVVLILTLQSCSGSARCAVCQGGTRASRAPDIHQLVGQADGCCPGIPPTVSTCMILCWRVGEAGGWGGSTVWGGGGNLRRGLWRKQL